MSKSCSDPTPCASFTHRVLEVELKVYELVKFLWESGLWQSIHQARNPWDNNHFPPRRWDCALAKHNEIVVITDIEDGFIQVLHPKFGLRWVDHLNVIPVEKLENNENR
jgi:hypothetical protein